MDKEEIFSSLTSKVFNNVSFKESFEHLEENHYFTKEIETIHELAEKDLKENWDLIWKDARELIQDAEHKIQLTKTEQEKVNASEEGSKLQQKLAEMDRLNNNNREQLSALDNKISQKENSFDVQRKNNQRLQVQLSEKTSKKSIIEKIQCRRQKKQEENKLRTLESELMHLQKIRDQHRQTANEERALLKKEIRDFTKLVEKTHPQLKKIKEEKDIVIHKAKDYLRTRLQERLTFFINEKLKELRSPETDRLPVWFSAWGITEVFVSRYAITTISGKKLTHFLEEMPGGSIGISGPRGSGKSTLIGSFCGTNSPDNLKGRQAFSIMLSAPVKYETRDFVLHVFSSVCNLVLKDYLQEKSTQIVEYNSKKHILGENPEETHYSLISKLRRNINQLFGKHILISAKIIGPVLVISSFCLAYTATFRLPQYEEATTKTATSNLPQSQPLPQNINQNSIGSNFPQSQPSPQGASQNSLNPNSPQSQPSPQGASQNSLNPNSPQSQPSHQSANQGSLNPNFSQKEVPWDIVLLNYLAALKVTPGSLLRWGIILTVLGIISSPLSLKSIIRFSFNRKTDLSDRDSSHELEYAESALPKSELVEKAKTHLESIRFQQSYTSGWVGSIKLPVLFETSANQAITISKLQMTFPEIIQKYKQFVSYFLKETKSVLIIGIDELDKLDAEKSKIFLNEIKALFGMENCFYLVSVSEDAMSSFERRGIPFRDAFDSTFDTIIYIDYLTLDEARELIDKRVIGLPKLAFYFIYCFSGGLARDLIRSCRSLLGDLDDSQPESFRKTSILDLCRYMICKDITAKIRSIYIEAKKTTAESTASNFLQATRKLETLIYEERLSSNDLLEICKILKTRVTLQDEKDAAAPLNKEDDLNFKTSLESLQIELTAYLYYMATLFEVFVEKSCVSLLNDSVELTVYMTNLTRARQFFTVNPEFACSLISDFRELQKLECIT